MMKGFVVIMIVLFACCKSVFAIGDLPISYSNDKDVTSFIYFNVNKKNPIRFSPIWEDDAAELEIVNSKKCNSLFTLPADYKSRPNPRVYSDEFDNIEFYINIPKDKTSVLYFSRKHAELTKFDSLYLFIPFDLSGVSDYSVSSFGIRAKFVEVKVEPEEHFHIDLFKNKVRENYPWEVFVPLLIGGILVLIARFYQQGYIRHLYLILFYHNAFQNAVSEKNVNADKAGYLLSANFTLNVALFIMIAIYRFNYQIQSDFTTAYLTFVFIVFFYNSFKRFFSYMFSKLFECEEVYTLYYKNTSYIMQSFGVILLVLNIFSFYVPSLEIHNIVFYLTVGICVLGELLKIFRLFFIIYEKRFPFFYLFLYLCAVEILPVVLAIKIVSH
ncbi:MAG: DUF4271 domain-containing protein [Bacteroidales bacterium]|nr:DUF4271 domain-containing protein [Bacteroidales bacterium]